MLSLHELTCYPRVSTPSERHGPLTSLSWRARHTCISWEARGTWGSLLTRGSRGARPPRLSRRPLDGSHWWRVAGNLVKDGRVPGHVTWDGKDKDSIRWTVIRAMGELDVLFVKALNNSVRHPPRHEAHPSEISWFPNEKILHFPLDDISSWTVFKFHLMHLEFHSSRQHLSKYHWAEVINFIFTPNIYLTPKPSPSSPFSPAISTQMICFFPTHKACPTLLLTNPQTSAVFQLISSLPSLFAETFTWVPAAETLTSFIIFF